MSNLLELIEGISLGVKGRELFRKLRVHNVNPGDTENPRFMYYDLCCEIKNQRGILKEIGYNLGYLTNPYQAFKNAAWLHQFFS